MKVDGWLEKAQFENVASSAPTPTPTGRVYIDTTVPTIAVPRIYTGAAWRPFLLGQTTSLVTQNSGTSCTVDWSTGLNQQVVLTNHCTISFINPQAGQQHFLVVQQKGLEGNNPIPWLFKLNMSDQYTRRTEYQPMAALQSSESKVYTWFYQPAVKAAYTTIPLRFANSATAPATLMTGIAIHPKLNVILGGRTSTPFMTFMPFYDDGGIAMRWGSAGAFLGTSNAYAAQVVGVEISPDGTYVVAVGGTTPFVQAQYLDGQGMFSNINPLFANPGTLPAGAAQCVAIHPSSQAVVVGHTTTPFMSIYPIFTGAFGAKLANPVSLPAAQVNAVAFSPTGDYLAVGTQTSPYLQVYPFDCNNGAGLVLGNPGTLPTGGPVGGLGRGIAWHPAGTFIAMVNGASGSVIVYPFNRAAGTFGVPTTPFGGGSQPTSQINCLAWSPCGNYLALGAATGGLYIYDMSANAGFPAANPIAFDGSTVGPAINDMVFHPSGEILYLALNATPFLYAYPMPRKAKNYLKLID